MPIHREVDKDFFKTWSPQMAYVLGFLAADGNIVFSKRGTHFFSLEIIDLGILEKIRSLLKSNHRISVRDRRARSSKYQLSYRLQIGSSEMCDDLAKLGVIVNKTKRLVLPNIPRGFLGDYVRGYFDGDGHVWVGLVHKKRDLPLLAIQTGITSSSKQMLEMILEQLKSFKINGGLACERGYFRLYYSIRSSIKLYGLMYANAGDLCLERKRKVFEEYIAHRKAAGVA